LAKRKRSSDSTAADNSTSTGRTRSRRPERRPAPQQGLLERYSSLLIVGVGVVGVLIIGFFLFQGSTRAAYDCVSLLTPGPVESFTPRPATPTPDVTPSPSPATSPDASPDASPTSEPAPAPEPTPRLGFTTSVLGRDHIRDPGQTIRYGFCPPTSGDHFNIGGVGPINAGFYPPAQERHPGGWVHNLEHGYVVALYRCPSPDDCPTDAELDLLRQFTEQAPPSAVAPQCGSQVIAARFDKMETRFALVAWGRALLLDEFDLDTALTFAEQWIDHEAVPERGAC
jgi:hypothetical protein